MPSSRTMRSPFLDWARYRPVGSGALLTGLMACSAIASAAPCFVQPVAGAKATLDGKSLTTATMGDRCESLQVQAGQVQVVYTDREGSPLVELVEAGNKPKLKSIGTSAAFTEVQRVVTGVRDTVGGTGPKQAEGTRYLPVHLGLPMDEVHIPESGLKFKVLPLPPFKGVASTPQARTVELRILPSQGGAAVLSTTVNVGDVVQLPRSAFKPGASYEVQAVVSTTERTLGLTGRMVVLPLADATALEARLSESDQAVGPGTPAARVARALVYASEALSFNSRMTLELP